MFSAKRRQWLLQPNYGNVVIFLEYLDVCRSLRSIGRDNPLGRMRSVDRREILPQYDHAAVCSKIFAKCSMQSCLSFKIIFSVSVGGAGKFGVVARVK
jgi:hypothetical protein